MDTPEFIEPVEPTPLQSLVAELQHFGKSDYMGLLFPVSLRLQPSIYGLVEAFANQSGSSRNKVINQLLEIALDSTLASLPVDLANDLTRRSGDLVHKSLTEKGVSLKGGQA